MCACVCLGGGGGGGVLLIEGSSASLEQSHDSAELRVSWLRVRLWGFGGIRI